MSKVKLVETLPNKWQIVSEKGHVIQTDINLSPFKARDFMRNWISSFNGWTYDIEPIKPLPKEGKD